MEGNDQVRFCTECNKRVYNLSSMTRNQAEGLFTTSGELCGKLERDGKGKIITADQLNRHPFFRITPHRGAKDSLPQPFLCMAVKGSIRRQLAL